MAPDRQSLEERLRHAFAAEAQEHPLRSDFAAWAAAEVPQRDGMERGTSAMPALWRLVAGLALVVALVAVGFGLSHLPSAGPSPTGSAMPSATGSATPLPSLAPSPAIPTQPPAQVTSTWTATTLPTAQSGQPVGGPGGGVSALPGGGFIDFVVNGPERTYVFTSPDGITWTQRGTVTGFDASGISGPVASNGSVYVALGAEGGGTNYGPQSNGAVWVSADLVHWTKAPVQDAFAGATFSRIAAGADGFVALGQQQATGDAAWFSHDGLHWSVLNDPQVLAPGTASPLDVVHGSAGFVMVGQNDGRAAAWTSPDGRRWTLHSDLPGGTGVTLVGLVPANGGLLALARETPGIQIGPGDFGVVMAPWTSADGSTWQAHAASPALFGASVDLAAGPGGFVAAGTVVTEPGAHLWTSTDGLTWTPVAGVDLSGNDSLSVVSDGRHVLLLLSDGSGLVLAGDGIHASQTAPSASPLAGDVPGPDATVPPGVAVVSGLRIEDLAGLWESLGLSCQSWAGGLPGTSGGYTLHCERHNASTGVDVVAEAVYWTSDGVQSISVSITSASGEAIDGATPAKQVFLPSVGLAGGDAPRSWVQDRIGDAACRGGCVQAFAGSQVTVTAGLLGTQQLDVVASGE